MQFLGEAPPLEVVAHVRRVLREPPAPHELPELLLELGLLLHLSSRARMEAAVGYSVYVHIERESVVLAFSSSALLR